MKIPTFRTLARIALLLGLPLFATPALVSAAPGHRVSVDWLKPSDGPYPVIHRGDRVWLRVSIARQRVYVHLNGHVAYAMVASTGLDSPPDDATPRGTFRIQRERGLFFYAPREREGARYWVSWLHHGEYLFHSVPTDREGRIIVSEARKLGREASHGCIRLTLPDARWIYRHIPYGTYVVIGG